MYHLASIIIKKLNIITVQIKYMHALSFDILCADRSTIALLEKEDYQLTKFPDLI